jgi:Flp pilus assembly protein protease CpaA
MYPIARGLQIAGLIILPVAILAQLQNQLTLWQCLTMAAFGTALFYIGYLLQGLGGGK